MKYIVQLLILATLVSCSDSATNKKSKGEVEIKEKELVGIPKNLKTDVALDSLIANEIVTSDTIEEVVLDDCPELLYSKEFSANIIVDTRFRACEEDRKFKLEIRKSEHLIYKADTLLEYEFNEHVFPTYIIDNDYEYILVERNDKPHPNKIDVFRIKGNNIDSVFTIPNFETQGMDVDNDGITEYWAKLNFDDKRKDGKIVYNPIIAYEIGEYVIRFDSLITMELNKKVYGDYYGIELIDTL